jgi:putative selenium metabolism protein SsnA
VSYLFKSATIATLDPPSIETADLRIEDGIVSARASTLEPLPSDEVIDASGKLLMPGLVCGHTHLYSALARGMPAPPRTPQSFNEILELIWWRLDRALDEETIYYSALSGAIDAARAGTTCLFDHHASPSYIRGSLDLVRSAIERVGLRAVLCYEVTDRGGDAERDLGVRENDALLKGLTRTGSGIRADSSSEGRESSLFRGMVGAHASFTLSDESLRLCAEIMRRHDAGLHIHVAEAASDVQDATQKYGIGVVERLARLEALNSRTILAHGVHLSEREIGIAREHQVWFAHNPRSNMNNQVGYAPVARFGPRVVLGTDGIGADMFEEARFAFFGARNAGSPLGADAWLKILSTSQRLASVVFDQDLAGLQPGSQADLIALAYQSPTPITAENLAWHFAFGMTSASVESTMVAGRFLIRGRTPSFEASAMTEEARRVAQKLWNRLE